MENEKSEVFVRRATGLRREWGLHNAFQFAYLAVPYTIFISSIFLGISTFYAGANVYLAILIAAIGGSLGMLAYTMLCCSLPRSGADYVLISRIIHPAVGFAVSQTMYFACYFLWQAYTAWFVTEFCVTPGLIATGFLLNNPQLVQMGLWTADPVASYLMGAIFIIVCILILLPGMKIFFKVQWAVFILALIHTFVMIGVFATSSQAQFVETFNSFAHMFRPDITNPYQYIIDTAKAAGCDFHTPFSLYGTLACIPYAWMGVSYSAQMLMQVMGEVKQATSIKRIGGGCILASCLGLLFSAIFLYQVPNVIGHDFNMAINYLAATGGDTIYPATPYFLVWALILAGSPILLWIMALGFGPFQMAFGNSTNVPITGTRILFATAFDRLWPKSEWLTTLSKRWRSTVNAYIFWLIASLIGLAVFTFIPELEEWLMAAVFSNICIQTITIICAILFPYRLPEAFKASPAGKYRVGKVPLISIVGSIGLIFYAFIIYFAIIEPGIGMLTTKSLYSILILWIFFAAFFYLMRAYRKRQGIDVDLAYKTIPPE
jgi:amino acid transporter